MRKWYPGTPPNPRKSSISRKVADMATILLNETMLQGTDPWRLFKNGYFDKMCIV